MVLAKPPSDPSLEFSGGGFPVAERRFSAADMPLYVVFNGSGGSIVAELNFNSSGASVVLTGSSNRLAWVLEKIESTFNMTVDELSKVCGTSSRKTIYNWKNGTVEPHKKNSARIFELLQIAEDWELRGLSVARDDLSRPLIDGQTLLELLSESRLDHEKIMFAGSRLQLLSGREENLSDPFA